LPLTIDYMMINLMVERMIAYAPYAFLSVMVRLDKF